MNATNIKQIINDRRNGLYHADDTRDETELAFKQMDTTDLTIFIQHSSGMFGVMNLHELLLQMKVWKHEEVKCLPCNLKEIEVGNEKAWMWIVQPKYLENTTISPLAIAYGRMVNGYAYISKNKSVGEMVVRYLSS